MAQSPERRAAAKSRVQAKKAAARPRRTGRVPSRQQLIARAKKRLAMPRLQMTVIVVATGGAGFLASYLLLQIGVDRMWLRYPLAVGLAYLVFFLLLRLWLAWQRHGLDPDFLDAGLDLGSGGGGGGGGGTASGWSGRGGSFGGGGASSSFEAPGVANVPAPTVGASSAGSSGSWSSGIDFDLGFDLDDLLVVAVVAAVALSLAAAALYVVYLAPVLLAEVLADGLLLVGLYKRLKQPHPGHWLAGAVRRTWVPALIVAALFAAGGAVLQQMAPQARSIGGAWQAVAGESG